MCLSEPTPYISDIPAAFIETITTKLTTFVTNDDASAKDLLEDIDRVRYCSVHRMMIT